MEVWDVPNYLEVLPKEMQFHIKKLQMDDIWKNICPGIEKLASIDFKMFIKNIHFQIIFVLPYVMINTRLLCNGVRCEYTFYKEFLMIFSNSPTYSFAFACLSYCLRACSDHFWYISLASIKRQAKSI